MNFEDFPKKTFRVVTLSVDGQIDDSIFFDEWIDVWHFLNSIENEAERLGGYVDIVDTTYDGDNKPCVAAEIHTTQNPTDYSGYMGSVLFRIELITNGHLINSLRKYVGLD
jgi:hypothetical protein